MSYLPSAPQATLMDCYKRHPELTAPLLEFAERLMRGESPLTAVQRERLAAYVSHHNGCAFCQDAHNDAVQRLGGTPEPQAGDREADRQNDPLVPLLTYAHRLNANPAGVTQADVDAIFEAGWDETALEHTALVCGFFNLMNRWVNGLGLRHDEAVVKGAGKMLAEAGYASGIALMRR